MGRVLVSRAHFESPIGDALEGFAASENEPRSVDVARQDVAVVPREFGISLQNDAARLPYFLRWQDFDLSEVTTVLRRWAFSAGAATHDALARFSRAMIAVLQWSA
jgi:hypothetical protein